ncbi:transporter [Klebsiella oxytoca]|nr:transporter [Klebsiella oxytoca]
MAKPIITLNGLKIVIMLGMMVIILTGIRFAADIIVPFILAIFLAVVINPLVQLMGALSGAAGTGYFAAGRRHCPAGRGATGLAGHLA